MPRNGLHLALGLLLSSCGGATVEDLVGNGNPLDSAPHGSTDSIAGSGGAGGSSAPHTGGSAGTVGAAGSGGAGNASSAGAAGMTHGDDGGHGGSGAIDAGAPDYNLIPDPSFESGQSGWTVLGSPTLVDVEGEAHSGLHCLATTNRSQPWMGPRRPVNSLVTAGTMYDVRAWVRISEGNAQANLALRSHCEFQEVTYLVLAQRTVDTEWRLLEGTFTPPLCTLDELDIYIEGPPLGVDIFVDDVALFAID